MDTAPDGRQAAELRLAGVGYAVIATQLGYDSAADAASAVQAILDLGVEESTETVRRLELERLDSMLTGLWPKARRGDAAVVNRVLRIMEHRAQILGLGEVGAAPLSGGSFLDDLARRRADRLADPETG